ncbi:MAG TPA: hypothetical protein VFV34_02150 [Blastocatellia bacterium]|nr:hypothetical protein [Blastocatellia bacterium]
MNLLYFDRALGMLSRTDFGRALALAHSISLKEASVLARLAICFDATMSYHKPPTSNQKQ